MSIFQHLENRETYSITLCVTWLPRLLPAQPPHCFCRLLWPQSLDFATGEERNRLDGSKVYMCNIWTSWTPHPECQKASLIIINQLLKWIYFVSNGSQTLTLTASQVPPPTCSWTSRYMSVGEPDYWQLANCPALLVFAVLTLDFLWKKIRISKTSAYLKSKYL